MPNETNKRASRSIGLATALGAMLASAWPVLSVANEQILHPLPFSQQEVRFHGEMAQQSFQVFLSPAMTNQPITFQLAPTSAISVMPEASWMHVQINGNPLQPVRLGADRATRLHQRLVGPQMLQPGWNTVQLSVDQRHRVDCSFPATFELWTDLHAVSTGFLINELEDTAQTLAPALSDLLSFPLNQEGRLALHGVLPETADETAVRGLADAMASIALALDAPAPHISVSHGQSDNGINVRLDQNNGVLPGRFALSREDTTLMVSLGGTNLEHWHTAAQSIANELSVHQFEGTRYAHRSITGSDRFTLSDIGISSTEFAGRHFEQGFVLDLPGDFFASDVGRAEIRLAGGYTGGLSNKGELSVHVNGQITASIALDSDNGEVFSNRPIYIDLGHFRPGHNEIAIVADVTHQDDETCGLAALSGVEPRFLLLEETEVSFPKFAQLGQLPVLAPGLGQALIGQNGTTDIFVPHPDVQTISAAVALRVRLALDVDRLGHVALRFQAPADADTSADNSILVAALPNLPAEVARVAGMPMTDLTLAWAPVPSLRDMVPGLPSDPIQTASASRAPGTAPSQPLPPAVTPANTGSQTMTWSNNPVEQRLSVLRQELSIPAGYDSRYLTTMSIDQPASQPLRPGQLQATNRVAAPEDLRARWEDQVDKGPDLLRSAGALGQQLQSYMVDLVGTAEYAPDIGPDADLVIQQMASSPWSHGPLTLVTASEPARLEAAVQSISQPRYWQTLDGSRAVFSERQQRVDVSTGLAETQYVVTQPTSLANWRLVLAGYYSNNPILYTLAILLIAPGLGIICGRAIRRSGQVQFEREGDDTGRSANA